MNIFVVISNYFTNGYFGVYSSIKRARIAFEDFLASEEDIVAFEDLGDYCYQFTTVCGETFDVEICSNVIDEEFVEGICKED